MALEAFNYRPPAVGGITSVPPSGGRVTVAGTGFGENDDIVHVRVGGNSCSGVSITAKDVELQCVVDPGTGASKDVSVWVAGQETVASGLFRYGVPTVTSIAPTLMQGGGTVTISGTNFGTEGEAITPSLGTLTCQKVVVTEPHARIECEVPLRDDFCKKTDCQDMQILVKSPTGRMTQLTPKMKRLRVWIGAWHGRR